MDGHFVQTIRGKCMPLWERAMTIPVEKSAEAEFRRCLLRFRGAQRVHYGVLHSCNSSPN